MIGVSVISPEKVVESLLLSGKRVMSATEAGVRRSTALIERALKQEMTGPKREDAFWGVTGATTQGLTVRSGRTRASVTGGGTSLRHGDEVIGAVGSGEAHLKRLEDGGTFAGTSPAGFARIPTAAAQTPSGVERPEFAGRSLREVQDVFLIRTKTGRLWAARNAGGARSQRVDLLYLLVRSVTIKPHKVFERTRIAKTAEVNAIIAAEVSVGLAK